jgi:Flp pilus assembly protein TadB
VAIAALVLWMCTAAAGAYLLATSMRTTESDRAREAGRVPQTAPAATAAAQRQPATPVRPRDRFDPPSLARAKSEPIPGMRALGEFTHPALAIIGLGFWLGYVLTHYRVFAAIGFGVLLGAICAGLSWFVMNARAARAGKDALSPPRRLLVLHAAGAALTLLIAALIIARA